MFGLVSLFIIINSDIHKLLTEALEVAFVEIKVIMKLFKVNHIFILDGALLTKPFKWAILATVCYKMHRYNLP